MVSSSLLHSLLLAWGTPYPRGIDAEPPRFGLPVSTRLNQSRPLKLGHRGAARATFLKNKAQKNHRQFLPRDVNEPIDDEAYLYVVS
jgi:hypothetical protein